MSNARNRCRDIRGGRAVPAEAVLKTPADKGKAPF
jgi:hypothetical protein